MGESRSSAPPALQGLNIEAVEWLPSGADSGLVRVRGRWTTVEAARPELPELVLRAGGIEHRFESLPDARFARDPASWRGSYLVPVAMIAGEHEALWIEWPGGVRSGLPPLAPGLATLPVPDAPPAAVEKPEGGQLIDQAVLAERRARRAEAAEQAQARVAAEAMRAIEALELQSAELERRLAEKTAERDALAAAAAAATAAPPGGSAEELAAAPRARLEELEQLAEQRQAALTAALDSMTGLRARSRELRLRLRAAEIAHAGDAARLAVLEAERSTGAQARAAELERRRRGEHAVHEEVRDALRERLEATAGRLAATETELEAATTAAETHEAHLRVESVARAALEDELDRDRALRAGLSAELEAERAARTSFAAELEAERAARTSFAAELEAERAARAAAEEAAAHSRRAGGALQDRIAELDARAAGLAAEVRLEQAAREQAEAAAAAARRPEAESGRMIADLDAAAAALRQAEVAPAEVAEVAEPAAPVETEVVPAAVAPPVVRVRPKIVSASGPPQRVDAVGRSTRQYPALRGAIVKLAHDDPEAAGRLIAALLPAQAAALANPLDYDLTIREVGTFAVTVAGTWTHVKPLAKPRPRGQSDFHLKADALVLAELLAGVKRRVGRLFGAARFSGSRRRLNVLRALPVTRLTFAEAARAGANVDPGLAYLALSYAVHPSWTKGERFTLAQEITGEPPQTWYLTARDGAGLSVSEQAPSEPPAATVSMSRDAFHLLLRGEPVPSGSRPSVRGDRRAVARMKAWTDQAQGLPGA